MHERLHQQASDRQKHIQEISEGELRRREEERDSTKVGINPVRRRVLLYNFVSSLRFF